MKTTPPPKKKPTKKLQIYSQGFEFPIEKSQILTKTYRFVAIL